MAKPETLRLSRNVCRHAKGPISEGAVAVGDWGSSGSTPSVTACAVPAPPRGRLWHCRKLFRYAGSGLALSGANAPAPPKGEPLAKPETLPYCQGLSLWERWHRIAMTERASPFGTAVQPCGNIPSREKAILENPQIFQHCKFKNIFSAEHGQSAAEAILNRAVPRHNSLSQTLRVCQLPRRGSFWRNRRLCV